jgi:hypothetical protein
MRLRWLERVSATAAVSAGATRAPEQLCGWSTSRTVQPSSHFNWTRYAVIVGTGLGRWNTFITSLHVPECGENAVALVFLFSRCNEYIPEASFGGGSMSEDKEIFFDQARRAKMSLSAAHRLPSALFRVSATARSMPLLRWVRRDR